MEILISRQIVVQNTVRIDVNIEENLETRLGERNGQWIVAAVINDVNSQLIAIISLHKLLKLRVELRVYVIVSVRGEFLLLVEINWLICETNISIGVESENIT
jgi:hypothetical protein